MEAATVVAATTTASSSLQEEARNVPSLGFDRELSVMEQISTEHQRGFDRLGIGELYISRPRHEAFRPFPTPWERPALW